jgi:hypothetical protein
MSDTSEVTEQEQLQPVQGKPKKKFDPEQLRLAREKANEVRRQRKELKDREKALQQKMLEDRLKKVELAEKQFDKPKEIEPAKPSKKVEVKKKKKKPKKPPTPVESSTEEEEESSEEYDSESEEEEPPPPPPKKKIPKKVMQRQVVVDHEELARQRYIEACYKSMFGIM